MTCALESLKSTLALALSSILLCSSCRLLSLCEIMSNNLLLWWYHGLWMLKWWFISRIAILWRWDALSKVLHILIHRWQILTVNWIIIQWLLMQQLLLLLIWYLRLNLSLRLLSCELLSHSSLFLMVIGLIVIVHIHAMLLIPFNANLLEEQ